MITVDVDYMVHFLSFVYHFLSSFLFDPNSTISIAAVDVEFPEVFFWFKLLEVICDEGGWDIGTTFEDCILGTPDTVPDVDDGISVFFNSGTSRDGL